MEAMRIERYVAGHVNERFLVSRRTRQTHNRHKARSSPLSEIAPRCAFPCPGVRSVIHYKDFPVSYSPRLIVQNVPAFMKTELHENILRISPSECIEQINSQDTNRFFFTLRDLLVLSIDLCYIGNKVANTTRITVFVVILRGMSAYSPLQ